MNSGAKFNFQHIDTVIYNKIGSTESNNENKKITNVEHIAVLSDSEIRKEIKLGNIILHDPDRDCTSNIQNCSVDITLGEYYYSNDKPIPYFNPWNKKHVDDYWGTVKQAKFVTNEDIKSGLADNMGLKEGDKYIMLKPGETILGHTREFIGGRNHITTMIKARSSMGRCNVTICRDAGWGDVNYFNVYTLEISNNGTSPIILPIGSRVGQIIFFYTGIPDNPYNGKYQSTNDLEELVKTWDPTAMLPKLYLENQNNK